MSGKRVIKHDELAADAAASSNGTHPNGTDSRPSGNDAKADAEAYKADLLQKLEERRFDVAKPIAKPIPMITLSGHVIGTPGNLVNAQGKIKQGKTGTLTAVLAAAMCPGDDHLGFVCGDSGGRTVLHFDTEQSRHDHDNVMRVALKRAGLAKPPPWVHSYSVTDLPLKDRREAFFARLDEARRNGGVYFAILDGVADIIGSPNDELAAIALVDELHQAAIRCDALFFTTLHENPGSEIGKTRGHLGSQLERKAETNLRLEKDADGITVIYSDRARHCHIPKTDGPRFQWSDEHEMHIPAASFRDRKGDEKREGYVLTLNEVFRDAEPGGMTWTDVMSGISAAEGVKAPRRKFDEMRKLGLLVQRGERWLFKG